MDAPVLTDGRLRDFDELARYDLAAYCSGETTRWGGDSVTPFQANVPVVLDRVAVLPGSYVFADFPGAVVIPATQIEEVLAEARTVEAADAASREEIARSSFALPSPHHSRSGLANGRSRELVFRRTARPGRARRRLRGTQPCRPG